MAFVVFVAGCVQLALGPGQTGITIDEPTQVLRTINWLDSGDFVPALIDDQPGSIGSEFVYGPGFASVAHLFNVAAGNEGLGSISVENGSATGRHMVSALLALIAAITAGFAVAFATGSRLTGLWAAAALLSIPLWTGMGFFNPKDTPVATGFTLFTASLIFALRPGTGAWRPDRWSWLVSGLAGAGLFLAVGTRPAMWLPLLVSLLLFGLLAFQSRRGGAGSLRWKEVLAGSAIAIVSLVALYPAAFSNPVEFLPGTLNDSADYPWTGLTLTAGELLPAHPDWWYLPAWTFASIPLLIGAIAICGLAGTARNLWKQRQAGGLLRRPPELREAATMLVLVQLLLLPLGSMVLGSTMYTGLRQHLYLVPAVAMLAGIGVSHLSSWSTRHSGRLGSSWLLAGILAIALVVPMVEQARLFPYNYVYVNPVAGIGGAGDRWEGDYWWAGLREASDEVPAGETAYCAAVYPDIEFDPDALAPCPNLLRPYELQDEAAPSGRPGERWTMLVRRGGAGLPPDCSPVTEITRQLRDERLVIAWVARC